MSNGMTATMPPLTEDRIAEIPDLYLIRHGQTEWNRLGRFQGIRDIPLDAVGLRQSRDVGQRLLHYLDAHRPHPDEPRVLCSPLQRAEKTAEIVARQLSVRQDSLRKVPELREVSYGEWEGMTTLEVKAAYPRSRRARKADRWGFAPPGGESHSSRLDDIRAVLEGLDKPTVIVSHAGILRICLFLLGLKNEEEALLEPIPQDKIHVFSKGSLALI